MSAPIRYSLFAALAASIATGLLGPVRASGQTSSGSTTKASAWSSPRTPWGEPDLQGVWTIETLTPVERPNGLVFRSIRQNKKKFFAAIAAQLIDSSQIRE